MRKILLRFDDICPTMNWEEWNKAKRLMDEAGVKALLGAIPDCKDPDLMIDNPKEDFWGYVKDLQEQGFTIAMHGYQHVFDIRAKGITTQIKHSEFAGHSYEVQYEKIKSGKQILNEHGIETDIFFAPAHSYDDNTLKALSANGFKYLSDGKSCKPYKRNGIICIPVRFGGVPRLQRNGRYTVVLHAHEWINEKNVGEWNQFKKICQNNTDEIMTFEKYKELSLGNTFLQRISERAYLFFERRICPSLSKIKHFVK